MQYFANKIDNSLNKCKIFILGSFDTAQSFFFPFCLNMPPLLGLVMMAMILATMRSESVVSFQHHLVTYLESQGIDINLNNLHHRTSPIIDLQGARTIKNTSLNSDTIKIMRQIRDECRRILRFYPFEQIFFGNDEYQKTMDFLGIECMKRYNSINLEISQNNIYFTNIKQEKNKINIKQNTLIILDLDETILNQKNNLFIPSYDEYDRLLNKMKNYNDKDLMFHLLLINKEQSLVVYRKYLLEFIDKMYQNNIDIMIYSNAIKQNVIYHITAIEIYYNYFYEHNNTKLFKFKHIISRISINDKEIFTKKLEFVTKLLQKQYENIVIIDDLGKNVWDENIPYLLNNTNILGINAVPFQFGKLYFNPRLLQFCNNTRENDMFLKFVSDFIISKHMKSISSQKKLKWINLF